MDANMDGISTISQHLDTLPQLEKLVVGSIEDENNKTLRKWVLHKGLQKVEKFGGTLYASNPDMTAHIVGRLIENKVTFKNLEGGDLHIDNDIHKTKITSYVKELIYTQWKKKDKANKDATAAAAAAVATLPATGGHPEYQYQVMPQPPQAHTNSPQYIQYQMDMLSMNMGQLQLNPPPARIHQIHSLNHTYMAYLMQLQHQLSVHYNQSMPDSTPGPLMSLPNYYGVHPSYANTANYNGQPPQMNTMGVQQDLSVGSSFSAQIMYGLLDGLKEMPSFQTSHLHFFSSPVDHVAMGLDTYTEIIQNPMDLGTIKKKIGDGAYTSLIEFRNDVHLTFDNAMKFNDAVDHPLYIVAKDLKEKFDKDFSRIQL